MTKPRLVLLAVIAVAFAAPRDADASPCGLPNAQPLWVDYGDRFVPFRQELFGKRGVTVAVSRQDTAAEMMRLGAQTVYWDMYLNKRVGTPAAPSDPATIAYRAGRLYTHAASVTGCARPYVALNELFGAHLPTPWSPTNSRYRSNVLEFARALAGHGARPFLLISRAPATGGAARTWWRDVGAVADVVRELYVPAPELYANGPEAAARRFRASLRRAVGELTGAGVPAQRVGIALGFHAGPGGREGLQPASAWLDVVRLETAAVRELAPELGISTVWSWGWGRWNTDPSQEHAACVYLWSRDPALCDASALVGRNVPTASTLRERPRPRMKLAVAWTRGRVVAIRIAASEALEGSLASVQRRTASRQWVSLRNVFLRTAARTTVRLVLPRGRSLLRVVIPARPDVASAVELVSAR